MSTCLGCGRPWAGRELHCDVCRGEAEPEDSPAPPSRRRGLTADKQVAKALALSEAEIRLAIKTWYRAMGAKVWDTEQETHARIDPGLSDLVVAWPGRGVRFVEVKSAEGRQTPAQLDFQEAIESASGTYLLARSLDDVIEFERRERAA